MYTGMFRMVTQTQVDEFLKFLSSEAREVQGPRNADPHAKSREVKGKGKGDKGAKGKGDQGDQGGKGGKGKDKEKDKCKQVCNYFLMESGCWKGGQYGFMHSKVGIKDGRCFNCGATGHQTKKCPRPQAAPKAAPKAEQQLQRPRRLEGLQLPPVCLHLARPRARAAKELWCHVRRAPRGLSALCRAPVGPQGSQVNEFSCAPDVPVLVPGQHFEACPRGPRKGAPCGPQNACRPRRSDHRQL